MFPLDFPYGILKRHSAPRERVLDPFCGRGTTNFAARLLGLNSLGVDSSPVATAITAAKMSATTVDEILAEARNILHQGHPIDIPTGEFWDWAYHPNVLTSLCLLREALLEDCSSDARRALRGIILGALHGPLQISASYFSNQCPRTYAPKPAYAVRYWRERNLVPCYVDSIELIARRARRYYSQKLPARGYVRLADSRLDGTLMPPSPGRKFRWIITSPPYYGMRTYIPDQWLRNWFVGGPDTVDYRSGGQLVHSSPRDFADDLRKVWKNARQWSTSNANLVIRFGGISNRAIDPPALIKSSLQDSGWKITTIRSAGMADAGKRQADAFLRLRSEPIVECDVWARAVK
jgi:hypothetical protein